MRRSCPAVFSGLFSLALLAISFGGTAYANEAAVRWESDDALYLAGAEILVEESVKSDLRASGESIVIADDAKIDGSAWLAGRRVVVDGGVDGDLDIRAQSVLLNGPINGDVSVWAVDVTLGPDTQIDGDFVYYSNAPADISAEAGIDGETQAHFFSEGEDISRAMPHDWRDGWEERRHGGRTLELTLPGVVVLALLAGLVSFVAPRWSESVQVAARGSPALAVFYGLVWMLGLPLVGIFAAFTIVGIPFAFLLMVLYGVVFLAGMVTAVLVIGRFIVSLFNMQFGDGGGQQLAVIVIGSVVLWAGAAAPLLGGFFWFASIALGIGAILIAGRVQYETL